LFTGGLWLTSIWQWQAIKEQADIAKLTLTELERPWIFVEVKSFDGFNRLWRHSEELMTLTLNYNLQNFGRTPALCVDGYVRLDVFPVPIPDTPDYGVGGKIALIPLPQGAPNNHPIKLPITRAHHQALIAGDARLVFFGFVKYTDTSGKPERISRWVVTFLIPRFVMTGYPEGWWLFEGPPAYTEYT
jgi:hypothetical protein